MQLFLNRVEHGKVLTAAGLLDINKEFGLTVSVTIYDHLSGNEGDYYLVSHGAALTKMFPFHSIQLVGFHHQSSIMVTKVQSMLQNFCYSDKFFRKPSFVVIRLLR